MTTYQKGDRIRMVNMPNDPQPIPRGAVGTITDVSFVKWGGGREDYTQLFVQWDNGRGLSCICPPDIVEVISAAGGD